MNIDHRLQQRSRWSASLSSCGEDPGTCCITCLLPCITFGQIAEVLDEGQTSCITNGVIYGVLMMFTCHWLISCVYREKLRTNFGLPPEPCNDCCVHCCCEPCALCEEHAELKARCIDPTRGWVAPRGPRLPVAPPMPPTMNRMN